MRVTNGNPARGVGGASRDIDRTAKRIPSADTRSEAPKQLTRADQIASLQNREALIFRHNDGETEGRHPLEVSIADLEAAGHFAGPLLGIVREKCLDCSGGSPSEVRKCAAVKCPLWSFRMGRSPFLRGRVNAGSFPSKNHGASRGIPEPPHDPERGYTIARMSAEERLKRRRQKHRRQKSNWSAAPRFGPGVH